MTPKEKAKELIERFSYSCRECDNDWNAKQFAWIAVDEIIYEYKKHLLSAPTFEFGMEYWNDVKTEIEKL